MNYTAGMKVTEKATGLRGKIVEAYTNGARVRWENGTYYTVKFNEIEETDPSETNARGHY